MWKQLFLLLIKHSYFLNFPNFQPFNYDEKIMSNKRNYIFGLTIKNDEEAASYFYTTTTDGDKVINIYFCY